MSPNQATAAATMQTTADVQLAARKPCMNASAAQARAVGPPRRWIAVSWPPSTSGRSLVAGPCRAGGIPLISASHRALMRPVATAASTAIPSAPPTCRAVLSTPEATPAFSCGIAPIAVALRVGMASAVPIPASMKNGQMCEYGESACSWVSPIIPPLSSTIPAAAR